MMIESGGSLPFLLHFGERIPGGQVTLFRYDIQRGVSQVFVTNEWVDALDVHHAETQGVTKLTDVKRETTDDD